MKDYDTWLTSSDPANSLDNIRLERQMDAIKEHAEDLFDTPLNCLFLHLDRHSGDWDKAEKLFKQCQMTPEFKDFLMAAVIAEVVREKMGNRPEQQADCTLPASHYHSFLRRKYR